MDGSTTFHFVAGGPEEILKLAFEAADGKDVRLGGGVAALREYLRARLVDELHLALVPVLLGRGEHLFRDIDLPALGYEVAEHVPSTIVSHVVLKRRP
jgi:dihydrofolate reductase